MKKVTKRLMLCLCLSLLMAMMLSVATFAADNSKVTTTTTKTAAKKYGPVKENGKWYLYTKQGVKATGNDKGGYYTHLQKDVLFYLNNKKVILGRKSHGIYYFPNGTKMDKADTNTFKVELKARNIANKITTPSMTKAQKRATCFKWVMNKNYRMYRTFRNVKGWPAVYADDHFKTGFGDCHSDAAAFGYLAKAIGYTEIYVCNDSKGPGHSWCEINGYVFDPLFAQVPANGGYSKNYHVKYRSQGGPYVLHPILHIKL